MLPRAAGGGRPCERLSEMRGRGRVGGVERKTSYSFVYLLAQWMGLEPVAGSAGPGSAGPAALQRPLISPECLAVFPPLSVSIGSLGQVRWAGAFARGRGRVRFHTRRAPRVGAGRRTGEDPECQAGLLCLLFADGACRAVLSREVILK